MKENNTEYINTEILTILSNRINDMYNNMFLLFPVEKSTLTEYIEFCSNNVSEQIITLIPGCLKKLKKLILDQS